MCYIFEGSNKTQPLVELPFAAAFCNGHQRNDRRAKHGRVCKNCCWEMKHGPAYIRPVTRPSCRTWTFEQATLAAAPTSGQNRCSICRRVIGGGLSGLEQHQRRSLRCLRWRSWYYTHSLQKGKKRRPKYPAACRFGPVGEKFRREAAIPIASCKADLHLAELLEMQQTFMTPGPANA